MSKVVLPKAAQRWVAALRSGDYKRARYRLRSGNGYCCLGVACDLSGLGKWIGGPRSTGYSYVYVLKGSTEGEGQYLPDEVRDWLGLTSCSGIVDKGTFGGASLAKLNDDNKSFAEIADAIEANAKQLFTAEALEDAAREAKKGGRKGKS